MEFTKIGTQQIVLLILGAGIFFIVPLVLAIVWKVKKKEPVKTILTGAVIFFLFAIVLEKPIQNMLVFPNVMGLPDHAAAQYINSRLILWAFIVGLFPGVFEETGRLVAYKTVLKKQKNRETAISYGIGHGGFEVMLILGMTYVSYISLAFMINSGVVGTVIEEARAKAPGSVAQVYTIAEQLAVFSGGDLLIGIVERIFAVMFHIGASILVFYACKDKTKFWLYPLAIVLHTALDGIAALTMVGVLTIPGWTLEIIVALFGSIVFFGAYFLLYKKDTLKEE